MKIENFLNETWTDIKGYEGLYQVSNYGRVKSFDKLRSAGNGVRLIPGRLLKPAKVSSGYLAVRLYDHNHNSKMRLIHRLVAIAFLPNPDNLPIINHKDEDKTNNFVCVNQDGTINELKSNLEWCTSKYNSNYGTCPRRIGDYLTNFPKYSKRVAQYTKDGVLIKIFPSTKEIQRQLGIDNAHVSSVCLGKTKSAKGFIFRYV